MKFWICPKDSQVVIYDASISGIDCTAIPTNVYLVQWHGEDGDRLLKHSDTLPVRERFYDPSQYLPQINRWILAAQNEAPPITLAQAKKIKQDFLEILFNLKRQDNIAASGTVYNATDTYQAMMASSEISALTGGTSGSISSISAQIAALKNQIEILRYYMNLNADILNKGTYRNNINSAIDSVEVVIGGEPPTGSTTVTAPMGDQALYIVPELGPVASDTPSLQSATSDALAAMAARTAALYNVWGTKFNEIQNLTTVAQVAAYDVTSGW